MNPQVIEGLQKKLDEKQVNPKDLNPEQRRALDRAFKEGTLKGYKNVGEMRAERSKAAVDIAQDIEKKLAPLTPRSKLGLGIRRGTLVAAGDIVGSFYPYIKDSKLLRAAALKGAVSGQPVGYIPRVRGVEGVKVFNGFKNLFSKIAPGGGPLKLFRRTGKLFDSLITGGRALATGKALTSQALRTELKSQLLGATGAAAGSVSFDLANFPARFISASGEDLSDLSENELDKMSGPERMTTMAIRNFRTALMWNGLAFGGIGVLMGMGRVARNAIGVNPKVLDFNESKKIIDQGGGYGATTATSGESGMKGFVAGWGGSLGLLPGGAKETGLYRKKLTAGATAGLVGATQVIGPTYGSSVLAATTRTQMNEVYKLNNELVDAMYGKIEIGYKNLGNLFEEYNGLSKVPMFQTMKGSQEIPLFPVRGITEYKNAILAAGAAPGDAARILNEAGFPDIMKVNPAMLTHATQLDVYLKQYKEAMGQGDYITYNQLKELREEFTKAYGAAMKQGGGTLGKFSSAPAVKSFAKKYEMDMLALTGNRDKMLNPASNPRLAAFYEHIKVDPDIGKAFADGPVKMNDGTMVKNQTELANRFIEKLRINYTAIKKQHELANLSYSAMMNKYAPSSLRNDNLQKYKNALSYDIATQKSLLGGFNKHTVNSNLAFKQLGDSVFLKENADPENIVQFAKYVGADFDPTLAKFAAANGFNYKQVQAQGKQLMKLMYARRSNNALMQSVQVREVMGKIKLRPLFEEDAKSLSAVNEYLQKNSPGYRKHYEETAEFIQNSMGITGRKMDLEDLTTVSYTLRPKYLMMYQNALESRMKMPLAGIDPTTGKVALLPKNLEKLRLLAYEGKGFTDPVLQKARRPDFKGTPETTLSIKEAWRRNPKGILGMSQKLTAAEEKALDNLLDGEQKLVIAAKAATQTYKNNVSKFENFEKFDFQKYENIMGLKTAEGRDSMLQYFKSMGIKNPKAHLELTDTFVNQLRRAFEAPVASPTTWLSRALMIGVATGGGVVLTGGIGGGMLGAITLWAGLKYSTRLMNSPDALKYFTNVYPEMQRRYMNMFGGSLRRPVDAPPRRDRLADFLNYAISGDPDAPYVTPDNIDDERIIKYLLEAPVHEASGDMLYDEQPQAVKELFDPDLTTIRKLSADQLEDVGAAVEGMNLGKKRDTLIEELDSPAGAEVLAQNSGLKDFIQNPPAANATINPIQSPQTANTMQGPNTYRNLFPGDTLGAAIAERKAQGQKLPYMT